MLGRKVEEEGRWGSCSSRLPSETLSRTHRPGQTPLVS